MPGTPFEGTLDTYISDASLRNMTMKRKIVVALGLTWLVLILAGCASSHHRAAVESVPSRSSSVAAAVVAPAAVTPTPIVWNVVEAGRQYLAIVKQPNADVDTLKAAPDSTTVAQYDVMAGRIASDLAGVSRKLAAGSWPPVVQEQVRTAQTVALQERAVFLTAAGSQSLQEFSDAITGQQATLNAASAAYEAIRVALGLPDND